MTKNNPVQVLNAARSLTTQFEWPGVMSVAWEGGTTVIVVLAGSTQTVALRVTLSDDLSEVKESSRIVHRPSSR